MKKIEIKEYAWHFSDLELHTMYQCLIYSKHRLEGHPNSGINEARINADCLRNLISGLKEAVE